MPSGADFGSSTSSLLNCGSNGTTAHNATANITGAASNVPNKVSFWLTGFERPSAASESLNKVRKKSRIDEITRTQSTIGLDVPVDLLPFDKRAMKMNKMMRKIRKERLYGLHKLLFS